MTILNQLSKLSAYVQAGQTLMVGYSGGLDSAVLLHALTQLPQLAHRSVRACHVHHGLSPQADAWAAHCQRMAAQWGVACEVIHVDVDKASGAGFEAAARSARHQALAEAGGDWLILAHHQGDQAETVLNNLLRGSGVLGLAGMPERSGRILRPLLAAGREQLAEYAQAHGLSWIEDESNTDQHYTRNWLRHTVLPLLRERFPEAQARIAAAAGHAGAAQNLIEQLAELDAGGTPLFPLPVARLRELEFARAVNLLRTALKAEGLQAPPASRLDEFVRQCREAAPDRHPALSPGNWSLQVRARQVWLERAQ